jgi:hypothetical protein
MSFVEYTITNTLTEIMVDIDIETGETCDVYAYRKDVLDDDFWLVDGDKEWTPRWKKGKNPVFVHLSKSSYERFARSVAGEYLISSDDLEEIAAAVDRGEFSELIFQNPILSALRDS